MKKNGKLKAEPSKTARTPTLATLEDMARSFFRQADMKRAKRLGKPFVDRYPASTLQRLY